jgi:hypothetical protein
MLSCQRKAGRIVKKFAGQNLTLADAHPVPVGSYALIRRAVALPPFMFPATAFIDLDCVSGRSKMELGTGQLAGFQRGGPGGRRE